MSQSFTCHDTRITSSYRLLASDLNEHNTVYGGHLLSILDGVASLSASRIAPSQMVTAAVDHYDFIHPFTLNDMLTITTYVSGVGTRSLEVFAKLTGERLDTHEHFLGGTAFLTFVLLDQAATLPAVVPQTTEERAICAGYFDRKQKQQAYRKKLPWSALEI
ncbi:acyl-CoA thioesterase [Ligilactobacillus saerimneri]|uniref:acyl-CoA thioesterase n=1 Tax=Ligilactobacillus saerimneri TaxID=228229 RepID=UPI00048572C7|nr:acyl-CoA thioesterase [Ligilactobacillus saerimneri]MCZ0891251.1 acyl-CoA thioesterase [Ligilactobacillus saerimneri]MDI9206647.1 acyl-CoA thioesterase [Ligilactobacillus saerimneri]MDY4003417.1 acyl-CoA thioesterase [Ligilactobacillus saerimneri]